MSDTISNAEIRVGVDASGATAGLKQIATEATQAGQAISRTGDGAAAASSNVDRASRNIVSAIQRTTLAMETGGKQSAAYYEAIARQRGIDGSVLEPYIARLREAEVAQKAAGNAAHEFGFQTAAAKREVLVLAHELSQGNFSKFGGSMLVIAEQTGAASLLFSAAGIAAIGMTAAVVGVGLAVAKGAKDQREMNNALIMTGNYAGTTATALNDMAHAAVASGGSIGEAKKAVIALAESGKLTGDQIGKITDAAVAMEHAGGQSIEKTIDAFKSLELEVTGTSLRTSEAISRQAVKLDQQYHFLTEAIYEEIRALEKEGDQKGASARATDALAEVTKERAEEMAKNIGSIQRGWNSVKEAIGGAVDALGNFGKKATLQDPIDRYKNILQDMDARPGWISGRDQGGSQQAQFDESRMRIVKALTAAVIEKNKADAAAIAQGKNAMAQQEGVLAASRIEQDNIKLGKKGVDELHDAINKYNADLDKIRASNPASALLDPKAIQEHIAMLTKAHTAAAPAGSNDRGALLQTALTTEQTALDREKSIYDARDKMLTEYHSKFGLSDEQFYSGRAAARAEYIAAEQVAFSKESALVKASESSAKNPQEVATAKEKYAQLLKAHEQFLDGMRNAGGDDAAAAAAATKKQYDDLVKATVNAGVAANKTLDDQIAKQREHNAEIGKTKEQIELAKQAQVDLATVQLQADADYLRDGLKRWDLDEQSKSAYQIRLNNLDDEIARRRTLSELYFDGSSAEAMAKASAGLDKYLDPTKAQNFGNALKGSLGGAAKAMSDLTSAMMRYGSQQAANDKARAEAAVLSKGTDEQRAKAIADLSQVNKRSNREQVAYYGDLATSAAGFFDEHSRGYKTLATVSQAFHAAELAMTIAELVPKGISAVLSQGQGDPYSAFGRMAAMAAIVGGLGVAIGGIGGGGGASAKDRQAAQGTGSVLGDSSAKSESISKSLDLIEKNTYQGLGISDGMLSALKSIDANIGGFASQLVRSTDITNPNVGALNTNNGGASTGGMALTGAAAGSYFGPIGTAIGAVVGAISSKIPILAKAFTSIFGGKQSVTDSGFTLSKTDLASVLSGGVHGKSYADITTDGGWFHSDSKDTKTAAFDAGADKQFTDIITSLADSIKQAGAAIGLSGDDFTAKLNSFVIDIGNVSLKDLKGDDLQKALESVFSKLGDDMAQFAVGGLEKLTKVGEGYLETLTRLAGEYQAVDVVFQSFGKSFGEVGVQSLAARDQLVQLAGGLDKFTAAGEFFLKNFFSEQEQSAALKKRIDPTLAQYGLSTEGDGATKMFRDFIVGLDTTTDAGAKAYTTLMSIAPAFKTVTDSAIENEQSLLQIQGDTYNFLNDKVGAATVLQRQHALALMGLSPSLREATQKLWDLQAAATAVDKVKADGSGLLNNVDNAFSVLQGIVGREKDLVQKRIDVETKAVERLKSLTDSIAETLDSFKVPGSELAKRQIAQGQIRSDLDIVRGGGALTDDQVASLKKAFSTVTQDASKQFGSREDYLYDMLTTRNDIAALGDITGDQLSTQEQQLDLDKQQLAQYDLVLAKAQEQVNILKGIDTTAMSIEQALHGLEVASASAKENASVTGSMAINAAYKTYLDRAPDAAGRDFYTDSAAKGVSLDTITQNIANSAEAQVEKAYKEILGRTADAGGLQFYMDSLAKGVSADTIRDNLKNSDEYKKLHPFAVGTNFVPQTMPALVHEGERIIPAADNRALMARLSSPSDNSAVLADAVKVLAATVTTLKEANEEMAKDMATMADALKNASTGGPLRVKVVN